MVTIAVFRTIRRRLSTGAASRSVALRKALSCKIRACYLRSITRPTLHSRNRPYRSQRISKRSPCTQTLSTTCSTGARFSTSLSVGRSLAASPRPWRLANSECTCSTARASAVRTAWEGCRDPKQSLSKAKNCRRSTSQGSRSPSARLPSAANRQLVMPRGTSQRSRSRTIRDFSSRRMTSARMRKRVVLAKRAPSIWSHLQGKFKLSPLEIGQFHLKNFQIRPMSSTLTRSRQSLLQRL